MDDFNGKPVNILQQPLGEYFGDRLGMIIEIVSAGIRVTSGQIVTSKGPYPLISLTHRPLGIARGGTIDLLWVVL
jgi:hypothetical protein